jgi:hypothetical protein
MERMQVGVRKEQVPVDVVNQGDAHLLHERVKVSWITADLIVFLKGMSYTWTSSKSLTSSRVRVSTTRSITVGEQETGSHGVLQHRRAPASSNIDGNAMARGQRQVPQQEAMATTTVSSLTTSFCFCFLDL